MKYRPIDLRCPACGGCAQFEEPFEFFAREAPVGETRPKHAWGGWVVVERFPTQFTWRAPATSGQFLRTGGGDGRRRGYPVLEHGLLRCGACHAQARHRLDWPADAFWDWEIRGQRLWAWDRDHALAILAYVERKLRPVRRSPRMRNVPSFFFGAGVRAEVARAIRRRLGDG